MTQKFEIELMKFADRELTTSEEADLLAQCEIEPERYRDLALALVEERRLTIALGSAASTSRSAGRPSITGRPVSRRSGSWSLVAAAAIALVVGVAAGSFYERSQNSAVAESGSGEKGNTYVLFQPGEERRPLATEFSPEAQELMTQSFRPWFQPAERDAFRQHGYELREEPKLYVFTDGQGNRVAVPQRDFQITKVSN